jgi:hypothetical protein
LAKREHDAVRRGPAEREFGAAHAQPTKEMPQGDTATQVWVI